MSVLSAREYDKMLARRDAEIEADERAEQEAGKPKADFKKDTRKGHRKRRVQKCLIILSSLGHDGKHNFGESENDK